jgi:hypothetical protein
MAFKGFVAFILLLPSIAISYYFMVSLPGNNKAVLDFEKQKYSDKQTKELSEATSYRAHEEERAVSLHRCLSRAESDFQSNIARNGTPAKSGGYDVELSVQNTLQHQKEAAIAECHRQYGK